MSSPVQTDTRTDAHSRRPRVALVGCGGVGDVHRERLAREQADIVALCDPDADALARMAGLLPARPRLFRTEQDLLEAGLVDAVVLCTPHHLHGIQVRAALDAGVHVLCEKPFVVEAGEAAALVRAARERGLGLFVSFPLRSLGHALFLVAAAGRIGPLQRVTISCGERWVDEHARTWRMRAGGPGAGFLHDAGAPFLDLLLRIVDRPVTEVDAVLERGAFDVDVRASVRIGFKGGTRADVVLLGDSAERIERIQLYGEGGTAGWSAREDAVPDLYLRPAGGLAVSGDPHAAAMTPDAAFIAALRSGRGFGPDTAPDLFDAASALPLVALLERITHQAAWK